MVPMDGDDERLEKLKTLSHRELEVLELVCQRHTYKQIGELLFIAVGTVQFHIGNIYQKFGITELAKAARQRELGLFCPLLENIPKQLPGTAPEEPEPPPPPPGVLAKVREDEPAEIITVNVPQRRVDPVPVPTRTSWGRRLAAFTSLFVATGVGVLIGAMAMLLLVRERLVPVVISPTPVAMTATPAVAAPVSQPAVISSPQATRAPATFTALGPSATPTVIGTATPVPMTPSGAVMRFGETWFGDKLNLTAKGPPYELDFYGNVQVDFNLENRTDSPLNFDILTNAFYIEFSDGRRFPSQAGKMGFNDFGHGARRDFTIRWNLSYSEFQAIKRQPSISFYTVGEQDLHARIPEARWKEQVVH